ncbi:MAG: metal ABC transporter substrate-binding protein [Phycisphaerales bacterium]|jgi:ABC-type Zn uptake system ZnuABC Zn-binding protein ZnuA
MPHLFASRLAHAAAVAALVLAAPAVAQQPGSLPVMPGAHAPGDAAPPAWPVVTGPAIKVAVTIAPLKGLVAPLLPAGSTITVLITPGRSEHGYEFTPAELASLAEADLVVYVGLNLEPKVEGIINRHASPNQRVVCFAAAAGINSDTPPAEHSHDSHDTHAPDDDDHGRIDPHLWLDPALCEKLIPAAAEQIKAILAAKGAQGDSVDNAAAAIQTRIAAVDTAWKAALAPFKDQAIVTHHDAFSRPAARYGLRIAAVVRRLETADPSPAQIASVIDAMKHEHVKTLFIEPQFNPKAAERIAQAAQVNISRLDPLGDGDWFKLMQTNLDSLTQGLAK